MLGKAKMEKGQKAFKTKTIMYCKDSKAPVEKWFKELKDCHHEGKHREDEGSWTGE